MRVRTTKVGTTLYPVNVNLLDDKEYIIPLHNKFEQGESGILVEAALVPEPVLLVKGAGA